MRFRERGWSCALTAFTAISSHVAARSRLVRRLEQITMTARVDIRNSWHSLAQRMIGASDSRCHSLVTNDKRTRAQRYFSLLRVWLLRNTDG